MTVQTDITALQRSRGEAAVALSLRDGRARLDRLRQQGSAKAILPRTGAGTEIVFLNTSGGLTGGDRLSFRVDLGDGCRATATTQTAERAYRAATGTARVDVSLTVGTGGHLDWLPQETILFDGCSLDRRTRIDLAPRATCLALEAVVLGRAAMGETVRNLMFSDWREIWRDGTPLHLEPLRLTDAALGAGDTVLGPARAFASVVLVAENTADALAPLRAVLDEAGVEAAASAFDGRLACRMRAADGWPLRRQIARALAVLRSDALPRVWQM